MTHDDRALMFLLKLEDAQNARAEARAERQLQREHEIRLKEMEIAARREAKNPAPKMHASAAHPEAPVEGESPAPINDLLAVPADIAALQVVEVEAPDHPLTQPLPLAGERGLKEDERSLKEEVDEARTHVPLPLGGEVR